MAVANPGNTSANSAVVAYFYLVKDTQANGAAAAQLDVLSVTNMARAVVNMANSQRFRVLRRITMTLNPTATDGAVTAQQNVAHQLDYFKTCNIPMIFSSTTGAITEIRSNNLFLVCGLSPSDMDGKVQFTGICRLRFSD